MATSQHLERAEDLIESGQPVPAVAEYLNSLDGQLDEEAKAALWLLAYALSERNAGRTNVLALASARRKLAALRGR